MHRLDPKMMIPCLVCGKQLESAWGQQNVPYRGTSFFSNGHYGSTAFDPSDGSQLQIVLCDSCLVEKARNQKVLLVTEDIPILKAKRSFSMWGGKDG